MKYLIFLLCSIVLYVLAPNTMDREYMTIEVVLSLVFCVSFLFSNRKNSSMSFFRHSNVFIVVFLIVFYQYYIDYIIGFIDASQEGLWINQAVVAKALAICNIAISVFLLGYEYQLGRSSKVPMPVKASSPKYPEKDFLCIIGYLMVGYFIITADASFFYSGYLTSEGELDSSFGIMVLLQSVLIAIFSLYCIEYKNSHEGESILWYFRKPGILVLIYVVVIILSGRRTEALRVFIMLMFAYIYVSGKNLNVKRIITYLMLGVVLTGVFGQIRTDELSFSEGVKELTSISTISPFTRELAGSIKTVHIAINSIPDVLPYNLGLTFFPSFAILVPGLDRIIMTLFAPNVELNSGTLITNIYWGNNDWGYGLGSSIVADVYVAFGVIGIVIVFFLLGRLFRRLETITSTTNNVYWLALCIGTYSQILYACRTGVGVLFLSWTYACIFLYFSRFYLGKKRS